MANWTGGVLTKKGRNLLAQVEAGEVALTLTKIKLGDGIETIDEVDDFVDLKSPKFTMGIASRSSYDNLCKITGVVASTEVIEGFYAREWGLFALDKDGVEFLYMIAVDDKYDWIPCTDALVKISATYIMNTVISNVSNIVVEIDYNSLVSVNHLASAACLLRRDETYQAGDILKDTDLRPGLQLECIQSGKTAKTELIDLATKAQGDVITDGTVKWVVSRPVTTRNDRFCKGENGEVVLTDNPATESVGVKFQITSDGVVPMPEEFYSTHFKYNADGSVTPV